MSKKFQRIMEIPDDDIVTPEDVNQAISAVVDAFRKVDTQIVGKIDATEQSLRQNVERVDKKVDVLDKTFSAKTDTLARSINAIELKHGKDGKDADEKRIVKSVLAQIPEPVDGKDGSPDSAEDIRNKLELLDGEDRLDKKAIRGLEDYDSVLEFSKRPIAPQILSGASGIKEIRAGSGITVDNSVLGYPTISATGSGSGTVTDVSIVSANGLAGTVATSTTTPAITLSTTVNGLVKGNGTALSAAVANTDYQVPITLTTTGSSGAATFDGTTLNIPQYSGGGGSGDVVGPASATDGAPALFDGTTGKLLKNSTPTGTGNPVLQTAPTFATSITGSYLTASEILITDGSKNIVSAPVATYPSLTELTYVKGVTSAIQTQLNTKEAALTFSTGLTRATNTITANISTGIAGSQTIYGGTAANEDLTIEGTVHATKTTSYVLLQPTGGNVGIGTTTPESRLTITNEGSYVGTPQLIINSQLAPTKRLNVGYDNSNNVAFLQSIDNGVAFTPITLNPNGGNVGIGTTTPLSKLSIVHGSSYASANAALSLISSSDPNRSMYAGYDNSLNAGFIQAIEQNVAFRPLLLNPHGGNVGIGTTSPNEKLDVLSASGAQLRLTYTDGSVYSDFTTNSAGVLLLNTTGNAFAPATSDNEALGTTALQWSDLFLAEGGVINWDNGDITLTQTGNELALAGGNLDIGTNTLRIAGDIDTDGTPATDDTWTGPSTNSFNAGATIAQWEAVYLDTSSTWQLTDADAASTAGGVMVALATAAGTAASALRVLLPGSFARNDAWAWTVGGPIYLSTTPGALTQTAPSATDDVVRIVGYAVNADTIFWNPSNDWITRV
jgi:hypothetical protein